MQTDQKLILIGITVLTAFCGVQTSKDDPTTKNVKKEETVSSVAATTLILSDGSAKGTTVDIPAAALPSGSKVALDKVDSPSEFTGLTDSSGSKIVSASAPVSVTATDSSGNPVTKLSSPMTIALPFVAGSTYLAVDKSADTLCAVLKSGSSLYVWRKKSITIDTTKGTASFKSLNLGIFQLVYCGEETLAGFTEAEAAGAIEGLSTFTFGVNSSTYAYEGGFYCVVLAGRSSDTSEYFAADTVVGSKYAAIDGKDLSFSMEFPTSKISDSSSPYVAVMVQSAAADCTFTDGGTISSKPTFERAFVFNVTKAQISAGTASGTLGTDLYKLYQYDLQTGAPASSGFTQATPAPAKNLCIKDTDSSRGFVEINAMSEAAGTISGEESLPVDILRDSSSPTISLTVGATCDDTIGAFNSKSEPYSLSLRTPDSSVYYITSVTMKANSPLPGNTNNACLELFNGNSISGSTVSDRTGQLLAKFTLVPLVDYTVFLPWDKTKLGTSAPVFDMMLTPNSDCVSTIGGFSIPEIPLNDKEMHASFTLTSQ